MKAGRMLKRIAIAVGVAATLTGCGKTAGRSNPIANYGDLQNKTHAGETGAQAQSQNKYIAVLDVVIADHPGDFSISAVEGEKTSIKFRVTPRIDTITAFDLKPVQIPTGSSLRPSSEPGIWIFEYTPQIGRVPPGQDRLETIIAMDAVPDPVKTTDELAKHVIDHPSFKLIIFKTKATAAVEHVSLPRNMREGDIVPFTVEARDISPNIPPTLYSGPCGSGTDFEKYEPGVPGNFFYPDDSNPFPTQTARGTWITHYIFDTNKIGYSKILSGKKAIPNKDAGSVDVCISFVVNSAVGTPSVKANQLVTVELAAQPPMFAWSDVKPGEKLANIELKSGTKNASILFTVGTINKLGLTKAEVASTGFAQWPGAPQMNCKQVDNTPAVQKCEIQWDVPCTVAKAKTYQLVIKASNEMNNKTKVAPAEKRVVNITPDLAACPVALPPVKTEAAKPATTKAKHASKKAAPGGQS